MDLLAGITHFKTETKDERVESLEQEIQEMEESWGTSVREWKRLNREWIQNGAISIDDYYEVQTKIQQLKARLKYLPPKGITLASATPLTNPSEPTKLLHGMTKKQIQRCLQQYLYGLVGVLYETFQGSSPTGKEVAPDLQPSLGYKGIITYTAAGKPVDKRALIIDKQYGLFVPASLSQGIETCIDDGSDERGKFNFQGVINQKSLPVLKYVSERTRELKEKYLGNWTPKFTVTELVNKTGLSQTAVAAAQKDLVGILADVYYLKPRKIRHKFFLPSCRENLARELLSEYHDDYSLSRQLDISVSQVQE